MASRWLLALVVVAGFAGCKTGGAPPPDPNMPLPPTGEEARRNEIAGDQAVRVLTLDPATGPADGNNAVRIAGSNFRLGGGIKVRFGHNEAQVLRSSDDQIDVQVPPGNAGDIVDVTVTFENGGDMALRGAYTYAK